jgi:hypothetical protein
MFTDSETSIIALTLLAALAILSWGFYRARTLGKLGILAWLQSVVLIAPWLLFFGLFAAGIYINIVGMLFLLVASTGVYVILGNRLRAAGQDTLLRSRLNQNLTNATESANQTENSTEHNPTLPDQVEPSNVIPIPEEDLSAIRGIFGIDTFFATETIPYQEGVICKGNLRGEPEAVFERLTTSLQEKVGDRYRLFLVDNLEDKPVVIVLPSRNGPPTTTLPQKILAVLLLLLTIATSLETGGLLLNFDFFGTPGRFAEALPIAVGI